MNAAWWMLGALAVLAIAYRYYSAFIAAKVGMTASIYFVSERLWKRHKTAAVLTMIALNSTYGAVVAHNYAVEARAARAGSR